MFYRICFYLVFVLNYVLFPFSSVCLAAEPEYVVGDIEPVRTYALNMDQEDGYIQLRLMRYLLNFPDPKSGLSKFLSWFKSDASTISAFSTVTSGQNAFTTNFGVEYTKELALGKEHNIALSPWILVGSNWRDTNMDIGMYALPKGESIAEKILKFLTTTSELVPVPIGIPQSLKIASQVAEEARKSLEEQKKKFFEIKVGLNKTNLKSKLFYVWESNDLSHSIQWLDEKLKKNELTLTESGAIYTANKPYQDSTYLTIGVEYRKHLFKRDDLTREDFPIAVRPFFDRVQRLDLKKEDLAAECRALRHFIQKADISGLDKIIILEGLLYQAREALYKEALKDERCLYTSELEQLVQNKIVNVDLNIKYPHILHVEEFLKAWGYGDFEMMALYSAEETIPVKIVHKSGGEKTYTLSPRKESNELKLNLPFNGLNTIRDEDFQIQHAEIKFLSLNSGNQRFETSGKIFITKKGKRWRIERLELTETAIH